MKANRKFTNCPTVCGFEMGLIIQFALSLVIVGIVMMVGVFILQKVDDKAGLANGDTFANSSNSSVAAVETGFDFMEIIILAIVAGIVILAIFTYIPVKL